MCHFRALVLFACVVSLSSVDALCQPSPAGEESAQPKNVRADLYGDPLPAGAVLRLGTTRMRNGGPVTALAFSPDGKLLASAGNNDGAIFFWDPASGKLLKKLEGHTRAVRAIAFSSDGKTLASSASGFEVTGEQDKFIRIWDPSTGKQLRQWAGGTARQLAFSPDGRILAACPNGVLERFIFWDPVSTKVARKLSADLSGRGAMAFSPDGKEFVAGGDGRELMRFNLQTGREGRKIPLRHPAHPDCLTFSPDGKTLAAASGGFCYLWEAATGKLLNPDFHVPATTREVLFAPDGKTLVIRYDNGTIRFFDPRTLEERRLIPARRDPVSCMAFSPDGKVLATGTGQVPFPAASRGGYIQLWDPATAKPISPSVGHEAPITTLAFFPDGKKAVSGGPDNTWRSWDLATGRELLRVSLENRDHFPGALAAVAVSHDGRIVVTGSTDSGLLLWDAAEGRELDVLHRARENVVFGLQIATGAKGLMATIVSGGIHGGGALGSGSDCAMWTLPNGKMVFQFRNPVREMSGFAISPDGRTLAWARHKLVIQDRVRPERMIQVNDILLNALGSLAFSPDGWLLSASGQGIIPLRLMERVTGKPVVFATVPEIKPALGSSPARRIGVRAPVGVETLAFSRDGRLFAVNQGKRILLWDLATGEKLGELSGHEGPVLSLAFSADGRFLLSGSADTTMLLWDLTGSKMVPTAFPKQLGGEQREKCWNDLASADADTAWQAIWKLAAAEGEAVTLLKERVRPAVHAVQKRIVQLIAQMDDEKFSVRETATRELEKLGPDAIPALKDALAKKPALETRQRIERLLEILTKVPIPVEQLRLLRAIQVMERIGSPEAREILQLLAKGSPEAQLTEEAQAALERLVR